MSIIDLLIGKIAPYECLGCSDEGALLCRDCVIALPTLPERCYRCHQPSSKAMTCRECLADTGLGRAQAAVVYAGAAKDLVWKLKSNGARAAAGLMAGEMAAKLQITGDTVIIPVPTSGDRVRQRGYDQAVLLSRQLSKVTGVPVVKCLARHSRAHQVGAGREQRRSQLDKAFRVTKSKLASGMPVLLVDDVITTGATLEAAAKVLRRAGARQIEAVAFAQPLFRKDTPGLN